MITLITVSLTEKPAFSSKTSVSMTAPDVTKKLKPTSTMCRMWGSGEIVWIVLPFINSWNPITSILPHQILLPETDNPHNPRFPLLHSPHNENKADRIEKGWNGQLSLISPIGSVSRSIHRHKIHIRFSRNHSFWFVISFLCKKGN